MTAPYPIIDASTWQVDEVEPLGTKEKVWLRDPDGLLWLFKQVRVDVQGVRGEDWAEKIVATIGQLLDIPTAEVELARRPFEQGDPRGIVSLNVVPEGSSLSHGNELLGQALDDYQQSLKGPVPGYTVAAVFDVLRTHEPTPRARIPDGSGITFQFAGYLVLDAIVGNTDLHHENWAVIQQPGGVTYLAPSFDHASSLGFQERADRKRGLVASGRVDRWTARGKSKFEGSPHPVDVALQALERLDERERREWRARVASLEDNDWLSTLERVPDELMSQLDRRFAEAIIRSNLRRLRHGFTP